MHISMYPFRNLALKTKCILWNSSTVSVPVTDIQQKSAYLHKISLKSGSGCWVMGQKRFSTWRPAAIFYWNIYLVTWLSSSSKSAFVYQFLWKSDDFSLKYGAFRICNMAAVRHLEFSKLRVYVTWHLWPCYCAPLCKHHWYRTELLSYGKKTILKMAAVHHLQL